MPRQSPGGWESVNALLAASWVCWNDKTREETAHCPEQDSGEGPDGDCEWQQSEDWSSLTVRGLLSHRSGRHYPNDPLGPRCDDPAWQMAKAGA